MLTSLGCAVETLIPSLEASTTLVVKYIASPTSDIDFLSLHSSQ